MNENDFKRAKELLAKREELVKRINRIKEIKVIGRETIEDNPDIWSFLTGLWVNHKHVLIQDWEAQAENLTKQFEAL